MNDISEPLEQPCYSTSLTDSHGFPDPQALATNSAAMLHLFQQKVPSPDGPASARLELFLAPNNTWTLRLMIDPNVWYPQFLEARGKLEAVTIARKYIDEVKHEPASTKKASDGVLSATPQQHLEVSTDDYCDFSITCSYALGVGCKRKHSDVTCAWKALKKDGKSAACGWTCFLELLINKAPYTDQFFLTQVRSGKLFARNLIVLPRPVEFCIDSGAVSLPRPQEKWPDNWWSGHYSNAQLARMPFFWQQLANRVHALRLEAKDPNAVQIIALNFGEWESKQAQDDYALECHGHAHIILSPQAQSNLAQDPSWSALRGRYNDLDHYALDDAQLLETKFVLGGEVASLNNKVENLTTNMEILTSKVDNLTDMLKKLSDHLFKKD